MKFVDEGRRLRRATRDVKVRVASRPSARSPDSSCSTSPATSDLVLKVELETESHSVFDIRLQFQGDAKLYQFSSPKLERDHLLSSFVADMFPLGAASVQSSFLGCWLWHVPQRLGRSAALDHAAVSLALAYFAQVAGDRRVFRNAQLSYTLALRSLAAAIADASRRFSAEVLCATLLLAHYEVCPLPSAGSCRLAGSSFYYGLELCQREPRLDTACRRGGPPDAAAGCPTLLRVCI
jgi:hypothetical protein